MYIRLCRYDGASESDVERALEHLARAGLCADECERLRGISNVKARAAGVGARLALLWALTDESSKANAPTAHGLSDLPPFADKPLSGFSRAASGAPCWRGGDRFVSLAHSPSLAVCALSQTAPIGVDVEPLARRVARAEDIAARYFSDGERALLAAAPDRDRVFLDIWTRKEALGKALGTGLNNTVAALDTTATAARFTEQTVEGERISVCLWAQEEAAK